MVRVKPYVRSMDRWWRRDRFFLFYMIREASSVFLAVYAVILMVGLWRLTQGEAAWEAWRGAMRTPAGFVFHWLALVTVSYHAYTWWKVAPKTAPDLRFGGRPLPELLISGGGWLATLGASVIVFVLVRWL